ncbi:MAG: hypothetical protein KY476_00665 [Planctomycetes bacterium]|nr:hypothetical protein [Planctomycetota bacterium]
MPHDRNGQPLQEGDVVTLRGRLNQVYAQEDGCNVNVVLDGPEGEYQPSISCNAKLVEKAQDGSE